MLSISQDANQIHRMRPSTVAQLLELNRVFYATIAADFSSTRRGLPVGWQQLRTWIPAVSPTVSARPLRVLDVGCGNGRFARLLQEWGLPTEYIGVDADAQLLAMATAQAAPLSLVQTEFVQADFTVKGWPAAMGISRHSFDLVLCFAALHHVPSHQLRAQVVTELANLVKPNGRVMLSHWQF